MLQPLASRGYTVMPRLGLLGCVRWSRAQLSTKPAACPLPSPPSSSKLLHVDGLAHSSVSTGSVSVPPSPCGVGRVRSLAAAFDSRALPRSLSAGNSPSRPRLCSSLLSHPSFPMADASAHGTLSCASAACTMALARTPKSSSGGGGSPRSGISFCSLESPLPGARKSPSESEQACLGAAAVCALRVLGSLGPCDAGDHN